MVVLMSYHKLVEREHVDFRWKCLTINFLNLAIISCLVSSWSLQKLVHSFDEHCVLGADVKFKIKEQENLTITNANAEAKSFTFNEFFGPSIEKRFGSVDTERMYDYAELNFLKVYEIDAIETRWSKTSTCDFAIFIPVFEFCFGIIITVMFIICGKGGKAEQGSFLPQPWRIVTPSLIFFVIMICLSIANLSSIQSGLITFCKGFEEHTPYVGCLVTMNNFAIKNDIAIKPSILYVLILSFIWVLFVSWLILLIIMIIRIFFVIDFQLVRVTIKTCELENAEGAVYEVIKPANEDNQHGNDSTEC